MDLKLTEAQQMLKDAARDFMSHEAPKDAIVRWQSSDEGLPQNIWQAASELGWLGILIPERYGGSEGTFTDAAVLIEELGRGPLPGPFFQSGVLSALTLLEGATEAQRGAILPRVAEGRDVLTVAITEPESSWGPQGVHLAPERSRAGYVLNGVKLFAPDATAATHFIVPVRTGEATNDLSLLIVDRGAAGVSVRNLPGFISWQAEVRFDNVTVPPEALVGGNENDGWSVLERAMEKALPVLCAYAVGGCQAVYEMSVAYSQTRMQFSVPIGRFQRVQDHIIRLVNHLDAARWTTFEALWKLDAGHPAMASAHLAKSVTGESYFEACNAAHEVHAGVGSSHEYGLVAHTS
ncbi:MAG TPA: acyl-CoA dehydrogenase family protein, partial [Dehalococcoidia bacterium]|nr:acyl-CoA dehydrogenase family protein [Dehalococcoidia bacterium]